MLSCGIRSLPTLNSAGVVGRLTLKRRQLGRRLKYSRRDRRGGGRQGVRGLKYKQLLRNCQLRVNKENVGTETNYLDGSVRKRWALNGMEADKPGWRLRAKQSVGRHDLSKIGRVLWLFTIAVLRKLA